MKFQNLSFFFCIHELSHPGGCDIGTRPIELHLKAFEKLGINITKNYGNIECNCDKIVGEKIDFDFPSVGATENAILAACLGVRKNSYYKCCKRTRNYRLTKFFE